MGQMYISIWVHWYRHGQPRQLCSDLYDMMHSLITYLMHTFTPLRRASLDASTQAVAEARQALIDEFNRWVSSPQGAFVLSQAPVSMDGMALRTRSHQFGVQ